MKFMCNFKKILFVLLIFFVSQYFILPGLFTMESEEESVEYIDIDVSDISDKRLGKLINKLEKIDWKNLYEIICNIAQRSGDRPCSSRVSSLRSSRIENSDSRTDMQKLFVQTCAQLVYEGGDGLLHRIMRSVSTSEDGCKKSLVFLHLVKNGAEISARDYIGNTVLHSHVERDTPTKYNNRKRILDGRMECTPEKRCRNSRNESILLSPVKNLNFVNPSDINAQNDFGATPLHVAMSLACDNKAIVEWLLSNGANPLIVDKNGRTPLHRLLAARNVDASIKLLNLKALLDVYSKSFHGQLARIKDIFGNSAIDFAEHYLTQNLEIFTLIEEMDKRLKPKPIRFTSFYR